MVDERRQFTDTPHSLLRRMQTHVMLSHPQGMWCVECLARTTALHINFFHDRLSVEATIAKQITVLYVDKSGWVSCGTGGEV